MNEIMKVESLESSLRYMEFTEKDIFFWTTILGVGRVKFPRKIKKRLSIEEKKKRAFNIELKTLMQWEKKYPELHVHVHNEISKLKEKYALVA